MSKIANYLRGHLLGEIDFRPDVRQAYINDAGILSLAPEMIVAPRNTDDIRKTARLSWQLAERGHVQAITARGSGRGTTGGAIGRGAIADMSRHMNNVFEYDAKQRLVRLQPGTTIGTLRQALSLQGVNIPPLDGLDARRTVGGAIADNLAGLASGKYGDLSAFISQLEIVLANGDILQTGPLGRRELSRKKGLQNLEGDIYRGIDAIIDEYHDVIAALPEYDKSGYSSIASVKRGNQFDLTPLFIGAQGTLGIISEMILRTEFRSQSNEVFALVFASASMANDAMRILRDSGAAFAEYFDAQLFSAAAAAGRHFDWFGLDGADPQAVIIAGFDDFNARTRARNLKKIQKTFSSAEGVKFVSSEDATDDALLSALDVARYAELPDKSPAFAPHLYSDIYIPAARFDEFTKALTVLAGRLHCNMPISGHVLTETYTVHPVLSLRQVGDKQKLFKIFDELSNLAVKYDGALIGQAAEGRIAAHFAYKHLDVRTREMYAAIKKVFDPLGIMNPGVKVGDNLRSLTASVNGDVLPQV